MNIYNETLHLIKDYLSDHGFTARLDDNTVLVTIPRGRESYTVEVETLKEARILAGTL